MESNDILLKISEGDYDDAALFRLPWAYKLKQLAIAVEDCYLTAGDFYNSFKYDNCNNVPRYDNGGMIAWWKELEGLKFDIEQKVDAGLIDNVKFYIFLLIFFKNLYLLECADKGRHAVWWRRTDQHGGVCVYNETN